MMDGHCLMYHDHTAPINEMMSGDESHWTTSYSLCSYAYDTSADSTACLVCWHKEPVE